MPTITIKPKQKYKKMIRVTASSYAVESEELIDLVIRDFDKAVAEADLDFMCDCLTKEAKPDHIKIFQQTFLQRNL